MPSGPETPGGSGAGTPASLAVVVLPALRLLRVSHWIKNAVVLLPVVFSQRFLDGWAWYRAGMATVAFCLASSATYVINDIRDRHRDRAHPQKCRRPLASGALGVPAAVVEAAVLLAAALAVASANGLVTAACILAYLLLHMSYTFFLKDKMLIDVICIALGFVLRAAGGALAIRVEVSAWLGICTFTLCLFLGFCKRRNEVASIGNTESRRDHKPTLQGYTIELLTQ